MKKPVSVRPWPAALLWTALLLYGLARVCQLYAERLPTLLVVLLHVVPPAVFALVHGTLLYRLRGAVVFTALCLGVGGISESLSLRTGWPFGHYHFTSVMGPKLHGLPFLLVLAYLGIGYCSWVVALLILRYRGEPLTGKRVIALPALASIVMLAWDLAMEADWSTVDRAWVWRDGGPFFGVPLSNYVGWYVTAFVFYQGFALYCRRRPVVARSRAFWGLPVMFYGVCAAGNLLILANPMAPRVVADATGKRWMTSEILWWCALVSVFGMGSLILLAWRGLREQVDAPAEDARPQTNGTA